MIEFAAMQVCRPCLYVHLSCLFSMQMHAGVGRCSDTHFMLQRDTFICVSCVSCCQGKASLGEQMQMKL